MKKRRSPAISFANATGARSFHHFPQRSESIFFKSDRELEVNIYEQLVAIHLWKGAGY